MQLFATRRKRLLIAAVALGTSALGLAQRDRYPTYEETLELFHISAASLQVDENTLADTILAHVPYGSTPSSVTAFLDSLGYVRGAGPRDPRRSYDSFNRPGLNFIYARAPYHEPYFSLDRFVCDRAALRLSFRFDEAWHLTRVTATTSRGCI